jgi:signal transduction histidine kinase
MSAVSSSPPDRPEGAGLSPTDLKQRRDSSRQNLLRANSAVAIVIGTVLLLALAAVWQSLRATRLQTEARALQHRAEQAENQARSELWRTLVGEVRATRLGPTLSRREAALDTVRRAAAIAPLAELRDEAVATLALPEYQLESTVPLDPSVRTYEFDPGLKLCALGRTNGDISIIRLTDGQEIHRLRMADGAIPAVQAMPLLMEFNPAGTALSARYSRGAFAVWDVTTGRIKFVRDADEARRPASRARFSSDGQFLVAPVFTPDGFAVLDAETGRMIRHFPQVSSFHHAAVRPGTHQFAVYDGTRVLLMDWDSHQQTDEFQFEAGARLLTWEPNGRHLAIVGNRLHVALWDVVEHRVRQLTGHKDHIFDAVFDPSGGRLATSSFDGTSRIWDLRDGRMMGVTSDRRLVQWGPADRTGWVVPRTRLEVRRPVPNVAYASLAGVPDQADGVTLDVSADGEWAVSMAGADGLLIWDVAQPKAPVLLPLAGVQSVAFAAASRELILVRNRRLESRRYEVSTHLGQRTFQLGEPTPVATQWERELDLFTTSGDGGTRALVDLSHGGVWVEHLGPQPRLVQVQSLTHNGMASRAASLRGATTLTLSPDGQWLVCGADGSRGTFVFDTKTGRPIQRLAGESGGVQFSPDGRWLVLAGPHDCRVWKTSDWTEAWKLPGDPGAPSYGGAAAFSPDGSQLALVTSTRSASLVETATGRRLTVLESPAASPLNALRWTADGHSLVCATRENSLDVWHPEAMRRELMGLGLDWNLPVQPARGLTPVPLPELDSTRWLALALLITAGAVAVTALLALRRHRRLIEDFSRTEAQALRWERELQVAREVGKLKSGFVSMVSHEFRTPLGIIQSSAEILERYLDRLTPEDRREQTESITKSVRRMSLLIDEVLVLGRSDAGQMRFEPAPLDLGGFARRLIDEMLSATHRECPIHLVMGDFPPAVGDENLLRHILSNLVSNAVKYSPAGSPVQLEVQRDGGSAVFHVRDQGVGIPVADQAKLFTAFHRGTNVGEIRGTGLGLNIVKQCVDLHGGEIQFASAERQGTIFTVRLPLFEPLAPSGTATRS